MGDQDDNQTDQNDQNDDKSENESGDEGSSILDDGGVDTDERAGRSLGIEPDKEPDDETKQDIEEEREKRLDPDNRPDNVEVDNTDRTFDTDRGMFTDNDDYDESEDPPFVDKEDPNADDDESDAAPSDDDDSDDDSDERRRLRRRRVRRRLRRRRVRRRGRRGQGRGGLLKILVAGAAGSIGSVVVPGLAALGHEVVGLDLPGRGSDLEADVTDPGAMATVVGEARPDAVIHLAGIPDERSLTEALTSHAVSTAALLEAMLQHDVRRIVYASSNHAVGLTPRGESILGTDVPPRPDTFYGVGKVAAEALLQLYADRHGIDAISTRIGSFLPEPTTRRQLCTWLSHDDAVRMFEAAVTAESPGYAVLYGVSANTRGWWDLEPGRALGYHPQDDSEAWAIDLETLPRTPEDDDEATFVGGPFATTRFERSAFDT